MPVRMPPLKEETTRKETTDKDYKTSLTGGGSVVFPVPRRDSLKRRRRGDN